MGKKKLTPVERQQQILVDGICDKIANKVFLKNENRLYSAYWGADAMFQLLWPYVGEAFEAGISRIYFTEGPGDYAPDKPEYLTQVLTELKSEADGK